MNWNGYCKICHVSSLIEATIMCLPREFTNKAYHTKLCTLFYFELLIFIGIIMSTIESMPNVYERI